MNLKLLPVLHALLRHRQVTRAARVLNMSQSSVSEALSSLRHIFNDDLLVSHGNQMRMTAVARRLQPRIERAVESVGTFVSMSAPPPLPGKTAVDIAIADYQALILGTAIVKRARAVHPDLVIRFHDLDGAAHDRLRNGDFDFVIGPEVIIGPNEAQFDRRHVFEDRIVCLVDENSPIQDKVLEREFRDAPQVFYSRHSDVDGATRTTILQQMGERKEDATLIQSYLLLPFFIEGGAAIALAQESLARRLAPAARVRIVEAHFDYRPRFMLTWDNARSDEPLLSWLLDVITQACRQVQDGVA